jgi:ribosomal protein L4
MVYAGRGYSASGILRRKRHAWKVTYGKGIARSPRKIMSRHGSIFNGLGDSTLYTRRCKSTCTQTEENQFRKINKKELQIAINSALSGTVSSDAIFKKYSVKLKDAGIVADASILKLKTKEFLVFLQKVLEKVITKH